MKIKRFFAEDMRRGLQQVKETLGPDAIILSNKKVNGGIELVAAIDPDAQQAQPMAEQAPNEQAASKTPEVPAESLQELLQRQAQAEQPAQRKPAQAVAEPTQRPEPKPEPQAFADTQLSDDIFPEQVNAPAADDSQAIAELRSQVNGIRQLLEHQLSGLMKQEMDREEPTRAMLMNRLMSMGLSERVADQIACFIPEGGSDDEAWEQTLHLLEGQLNTTSDDILTRG
ncbi:MAG: flagellar biosynthesis protein FlhF, partial [Pseudomonadota bacterium]